MLDGASELGQWMFLLRTALYYRWKEGLGETTIRQIFHDVGMSHFSPEHCQSLFLRFVGDRMIQINSIVEPFTTGNVFNLDTDILIAINTNEESKFLDFVDERLARLIQSFGHSPIERQQLEEIHKITNVIEKLRSLIKFLRKHPKPLFTY